MIKRLLSLNGVAILCVILFHASGWGFVALLSWADRYGAVPIEQVGTGAYFMLRAIEQLIVFCIPAFLFVSGFFIAFATGRANKTVAWHVVGIRIKDLIIPYTLWTFIYWILIVLEANFMDGRNYFLSDYVVMYLTGNTDPAYYYVPLLIQFYLLSPFLVRWAKINPISLLVIAGIIQLAVQLQYYPSLLGSPTPYLDVVPKWLFVTRIFWFSLGVVVGFNLKPVQKWVVQHRLGLLITAIVLYPLGIIEWEIMQTYSGELVLQHRETILDSIFTLAVIFAFLGYYQTRLPGTNALNELGSKSFGIYLIHTMAMTYTARIIAVKFPQFLAFQMLFIVVMAVVGLAVPLALMGIVNRLPLRPFYKFIFG